MPQQLPSSVAAVDLGSNSFHMLICSLKDGKLQTVDRLKEMVRLASGLDENKNLDQETQQRALACLERFGQRIRNFPPHSVSIVGTNTLRTARNSRKFIAKAEKALGHPIHIVSGIEEARLIYQGVANSLGSNANNRFVMDIGGGSTEYIIGSNNVAHTKESLHMGCVTFSNMFFKNGVLSKKAFKKATLLGEQRLEPFQQKFNRSNWDEAIGASGSLKAISNVLQATGWSNNGITIDGLEQLVAHIGKCRHIDELNLPELSSERLPVFTGGVAIVYATFRALGIEQMTVSDGALREGLIHDLLGRIYDHDIRSQTSRTIAEHYRADLRHAENLKQTIRNIVRQLSKHPCLSIDNQECLQFLEWAAELHEIGQSIAHSQYHKHSAYIIENGDFAGFSRQDQILLATIVRSHRKKFSLSRFENLHAPWDRCAPILAIILRLAVLLHRNRHSPCPEFRITFIKNTIHLQFQENWLDQAPLTQTDLELEASFLNVAKFKLEFH
ncbi:exopolyphosphatase [Methylomarinum vadi]|uniref:exopolyphosphatase n=1 Tax=Methylomarinum vadi TaxID=438855 RepID=UPI0004DEF915|nr:exopolyphosphatase [Methylomarinum vadi]